jgi:hypothetical protein
MSDRRLTAAHEIGMHVGFYGLPPEKLGGSTQTTLGGSTVRSCSSLEQGLYGPSAHWG